MAYTKTETKSKADLTILAVQVFKQKRNSSLTEVFGTEDGNLFYQKAMATDNAKKKGLSKIYHISKSEAMKKQKDYDKTVEERKEKIKEALEKQSGSNTSS